MAFITLHYYDSYGDECSIYRDDMTIKFLYADSRDFDKNPENFVKEFTEKNKKSFIVNTDNIIYIKEYKYKFTSKSNKCLIREGSAICFDVTNDDGDLHCLSVIESQSEIFELISKATGNTKSKIYPLPPVR